MFISFYVSVLAWDEFFKMIEGVKWTQSQMFNYDVSGAYLMTWENTQDITLSTGEKQVWNYEYNKDTIC